MKITHLILFVTARCNSQCVMCFNDDLNSKTLDELTFKEYTEIAKNIKSGLKVLMISGGEPSLRQDLPEICKAFYDYSGVSRIELPFNGHDKEATITMVERTLRLCPKIQLNVRLSIDGIGKAHDMQRGLEGSFDKVMATHEALYNLSKRYRNLKRGVTTTVTTINSGHIEELMDYIYNLSSQPDYHDIMVCRIQAGSKTDNGLLIDGKEYERVLRIADRHAFHYSRKRYGGTFLASLGYLRHKMLDYIYLNAYLSRQTIRCNARQFSRVIEADGRVRICEMDEVIGNIKDHNYKLYKMDEALHSSSELTNCTCTHPCFIVPSLGYPSNMLRCIFHVLADAITRWGSIR